MPSSQDICENGTRKAPMDTVDLRLRDDTNPIAHCRTSFFQVCDGMLVRMVRQFNRMLRKGCIGRGNRHPTDVHVLSGSFEGRRYNDKWARFCVTTILVCHSRPDDLSHLHMHSEGSNLCQMSFGSSYQDAGGGDRSAKARNSDIDGVSRAISIDPSTSSHSWQRLSNNFEFAKSLSVAWTFCFSSS